MDFEKLDKLLDGRLYLPRSKEYAKEHWNYELQPGEWAQGTIKQGYIFKEK